MDPTELPLRDLHLPDPVGWWPLAPGWWFVIVVLVISVGWLLLQVLRAYRINAARRYAVRRFGAIEAEYRRHRDPVLLGKQLSQLLRRSMLAYAPRADVAGLTGAKWLEWLDRDLPVPYFHTEGGKSLSQLPYRNPADDFRDIDIGALCAAVKMRLVTPLGTDA